MSDNIKVVVKVRPLISREIEEKHSYQWRVQNDTLYQIDQNGKDLSVFTFDKVYDKDTKTADVYNDIAKPIVEAATAGFNGTIFAYGQTSSGKTYTMTGTEESPGIIPLAILNLFEIIKSIPKRDFLVRVSYLEIYNETLIDLLNIDKKNIKIQDTIHGVKVDATERVTSSPEEVLEVMNEGKANRQTGSTNMNEESSRSHSIFQITIESREHIEGEEEVGCVNVSQLNLVDLAGSERAGQTGATGLRFKEGTHINKSLSSLALVIKQLSDDPNKHVNYRDSKLTRILQNSLGGNAKTSIICAVTPAAIEETISTLQFANRAKSIKNKPAVNAVATDATMIQHLTKQLSTLKTELENKKSLEKDNHSLQKQIAALQKLILNGFGQRSTAEILNPRRKLVQPRRITISTLHSIQEDPVPDVPKFCTPSLKYNPLVIPSASEFPAIQNASSLPTLSEEPPRLITPPPQDKKVNFNEEIIELDSDDDSISEPQTCPTSPYHKCYESTKTPPCILRKNAKRAEKNLKDIVELTEREKIYMPSVVEVMEKLDQNATVIAKLEDEINALNSLSKEKDMQMEKLKSKINKAEEEMNMISSAKLELESTCRDYNTKLTDLEVSYESLKRKAKSREEELLLLLEEQAPKKIPEPIGKVSSNENGEVRTENSNEQSFINDSNITQTWINQINELKAQLISKDLTIQELQLTISENKKNMTFIENTCKIYETHLEDYKKKLTFAEKQLSEHKSTVISLNKIIETQNENIRTLNADIESHNKLVQELQIKLRTKDNININDKELDTLIANEETFLANNENITNIIQSFKILLQSKSKEIKTLKASLEKAELSTEYEKVKEEIATKNKEIATLTEEIQILKTQKDDNVNTINSLLSDKNNLSLVLNEKVELSTKLTDIEKCRESLCKENERLLEQVDQLKAANQELAKELERKNVEITNKCKEIEILENENLLKTDAITSMKKTHEESQEHLNIVKSALFKVQSIMTILTGNIYTVPDIIDNFVSLFNALVKDLSKLEKIASEIMLQKNELMDLIEKCESQYTSVEKQIDNVIENLNKGELGILETFEEDSKIVEMNLEVCNKKPINSTLVFNKLKCKVSKLVTILDIKHSMYLQRIQSKDNEIAELKECHKNHMEEKAKELLLLYKEKDDLERKRNQLLTNILNKSIDLTEKFNIENSISCQFGDEEQNAYEEILLTLDKIANHIEVMSNNNANDNLEEVLEDAKKEIRDLTEQNLKFMNDISRMEVSNVDLSEALDKIRQVNKELTEDLEKSGQVLELLQQELKNKLSEMDNIEAKAKQWKNQFVNLNFLVKEQIYALKLENANFNNRYSASFSRINNKFSYESCESDSCSYQQSFCPESSRNKIELKSPQSLLTLCCNILENTIQPNETISQNYTPSNSKTNTSETIQDPGVCKCDKYLLELEELRDKNLKLDFITEQLQRSNQDLINERNEVQNELKSLLAVTYELQKRVVNHRTNLSTLTATTYAENKSLSSQIKCLQHLHNRFHTVCQRDIPAFKKQLQDLMTLLRNESIISTDSINRFSLPNALDSTSLLSNFKNESTLDGDLLMLDTNVTLTTTGDTTLVGHDQTCFDVTQVCVYNEVACQTIDVPQVNQTLFYPQTTIVNENCEITESIEELKKENSKLRDMVDDYLATKKSNLARLVDVQTSPFKAERSDPQLEESLNYEDLLTSQEQNIKEIESLNEKISTLECEKSNIMEKYKNLLLELPSTDALVKKLGILEKEQSLKIKEIDSLKSKISSIKMEMSAMQDENDNLSTQVMEVISELDDLKKEHDNLKTNNTELSEKNSQLQIELETLKCMDHSTKSSNCPFCQSKDKLIISLQEKLRSDSHVRLSRSFSDSDRSSSYNTICTLQNELHAGKEDCNKLKEEVTTIKNHLDCSNFSIVQAMDLDESMCESITYSDNKDSESIEPKYNMPDIPEERPLDMYALDKVDCLNYYIEITGSNTESLNHDIRIIEVMKLLYNNVLSKHSNEVENLINKLRDFEDSKKQLQSQLDNITKEHSCKTKELQDQLNELETLKQMLSIFKNNILNNVNKGVGDDDVAKNFKEKFLKSLDIHFGIDSISSFESVLNVIENKFKCNLDEKNNQCAKLEIALRNTQEELNTVNITLTQLKSEFLEKDNEFNLLKKQKEKIQEINNAVTLDIVKKEQELDKIMTDGCKKLLNHNILEQRQFDQISPVNITNIESIFEMIIKQVNDKRTMMEQLEICMSQEMTNLKSTIQCQNVELQSLSRSLQKNNNDLLTKSNLAQDLKEIYDKKVEENNINLAIITKMREEIDILKESLLAKQGELQTLDSNTSMKKQIDDLEDKTKELLHSKDSLEEEIINLKSINEKIIKEKNDYANQLDELRDTIKNKIKEIETLTSDIIVLKENVSIIENLKKEVKTLFEDNSQLKEQLQQKTKDCSRLEMNIKTHEKTAEIQSRMIMRLKKQNEEDNEKDKQIEELKRKCSELQTQCDTLHQDVKKSKDELTLLQNAKQSLEAQISELQEAPKPRLSVDATADSSRRRRQSIHDSKRMFAEENHDADHSKMEVHFGSRPRNDDSFMDVDDVESNRSTPLRLSKGRDSSQFKNDQSDKYEDPPSRPSSVLAARRRRQSLHDLHRSVLSQSPSPHDNPRLLGEAQDVQKLDNHHDDSEVTQLKKQLASCQDELEDLKEKYKELDDECETCAQYLRERDEQCLRLKRDKQALEQAVSELQVKLQANHSFNRSERRTSFSDAAVNTDEDWTNLHSVVVDRMSYDAEVEKNKKLTRTIEELRFKKQDLKATMAKMQKALEKKSLQDNRDKELEATKSELHSCRQELQELKERYKELDEECETCAEYLRERDEQCRKLKEAKTTLEAKLRDYEDDTSNITLSVRKKRQTLHDQNRLSATSELVDASTETNEDFLSYQVEKDTSRRIPEETQIKEIKRLRMAVDRLSQQKAALEQRLMAAAPPSPLYVATGSAIVQNQQLTDVMKENQKLKKINAKLITICKKRGKTLSESNRENQDPSEHI